MRHFGLLLSLSLSGCLIGWDPPLDGADTQVDTAASDSGDTDPGDTDTGGTDTGSIRCDPDAFIECATADTARFCNSTGDGYTDEACDAGCNATTEQCNDCVPDLAECSGTTLQTCDGDGLLTTDVACALDCVDAVGQDPAHCEHLLPLYLPDICDTLAEEASLEVTSSASFDTSNDLICNGGVVAQDASPDFCVMRYGTFSLQSGRTMTVTGGRALAIITDGDLTLDGTLDAGADSTTSGPGGGTTTSGTAVDGVDGGGGAGFRTAGGTGGGGGAGGSSVEPLSMTRFIGGPKAASSSFDFAAGRGGGGGGAVTLISCRGTVSVSGTIDVGGGGGTGGRDAYGGAQIQYGGAGGGGAGGQVLLQGIDVVLSGYLYANGGGGGGGTGENDTTGNSGGNGPRAVRGGTGGSGAGTNAGDGGTGGSTSSPSSGGSGASGASSGGGGGSAGFLYVAVPSGVSPTLNPTETSPSISATRTVPTF